MTDLQPLLDLFEGPAADRNYSESVTQLEHALQCAALARGDQADDALVAAALLHDVGHLLTEEQQRVGLRADEDFHHEAVGGRFLRRWFGPAVTSPVVLHVLAKRYLCTAEPGYRDALSTASAHSLGLQGGAMTEVECAEFEQRPGWREAVALRRWDDEAKVVGATCPRLAAYVPLLRRLVAHGGSSRAVAR